MPAAAAEQHTLGGQRAARRSPTRATAFHSIPLLKRHCWNPLPQLLAQNDTHATHSGGAKPPTAGTDPHTFDKHTIKSNMSAYLPILVGELPPTFFTTPCVA